MERFVGGAWTLIRGGLELAALAAMAIVAFGIAYHGLRLAFAFLLNAIGRTS